MKNFSTILNYFLKATFLNSSWAVRLVCMYAYMGGMFDPLTLLTKMYETNIDSSKHCKDIS